MGIARSSLVAVVMLAARTASADVDIAKADKLFAEGLALRESNLEQSCAKFEESLRYNPQAIGTLLNVALCDEKLGRIASAVAKFSEARDRAKEQQLADHLQAAEEHIAALTPELPYLTIRFTAPPIAGTTVVVDDQVVPMTKLERLPVDPGERLIVVSAPGRLPYQAKLILARREVQEVEIGELARSVTVKSSRRTIGIVTTASGGATIAAAVIVGVVARSRYFDARANCVQIDGTYECPPMWQTRTEQARTLGTVGTVVGAVGVAATGVGLYLWLRAPKSTEAARLSVVPQLTPEAAGLAAVGRF